MDKNEVQKNSEFNEENHTSSRNDQLEYNEKIDNGKTNIEEYLNISF